MRNLTPQTQPCTCVCIYKANISCLIYDILYLRAIFVPLTYFTGQTVTVLKVNQFLCSEVSDVYIPNAVISIFCIITLISLLLHIQIILSFTSSMSSSPFPGRKELVTLLRFLTDYLDDVQLTRLFW